MTNTICRTMNLTKTFGSVVAVNDVSLDVRAGQVFGFLGPNGAGKTSTIGMILGLIHPTEGNIELFGRPISPNNTDPLRNVGSLVGRPSLLPYLTGRENLELLARFHKGIGDARICEVLEMVGMTYAAERRTKTYSTGMKQRLGLAAAILHRPALIVLDEPTNGLDPAGMREVRHLVASLSEEGATVFLSSHLLHEVEQICDQIAVINKGRIVIQGSVGELLNKNAAKVKVKVPVPEQARAVLQRLSGLKSVTTNGSYLEVAGIRSEEIVKKLVQEEIFPSEVLVQKDDLENLFLGLTEGVVEISDSHRQ